MDDMLDIVQKDDVSGVTQIFDKDLIPEFWLIILSMTYEDVAYKCEVEELNFSKWSLLTLFLEAFYFCRYVYLYK